MLVVDKVEVILVHEVPAGDVLEVKLRFTTLTVDQGCWGVRHVPFNSTQLDVGESHPPVVGGIRGSLTSDGTSSWREPVPFDRPAS